MAEFLNLPWKFPHHPSIIIQGADGSVTEFEIWQGLANLYSSLSYWRDAEICLKKARALKSYSAATLHAEGEARFIISITLMLVTISL